MFCDGCGFSPTYFWPDLQLTGVDVFPICQTPEPTSERGQPEDNWNWEYDLWLDEYTLAAPPFSLKISGGGRYKEMLICVNNQSNIYYTNI